MQHFVLDSTIKDEIQLRLGRVETDLIKFQTNMMLINSSVFGLEDLMTKSTKNYEAEELFDMSSGVTGYLNRLDQIHNYTSQSGIGNKKI
jgi:hypothetical protein